MGEWLADRSVIGGCILMGFVFLGVILVFWKPFLIATVSALILWVIAIILGAIVKYFKPDIYP